VTDVKTGTDWLRQQVTKVSVGGALPVTEQVAVRVEVEAWLQRHAVSYAPPTLIPMAVIDERRSRANQARRDAIVAESVERFAAALRNGVQLPPIVAYPLGGRLIIIDGNNRQAAHRRVGAEHILGIIIAENTPSELIQLLTVEANAHHGVTPELAWRLQQAFHLCSLGFTDQAAAEATSLSLQQLRSARTVQEADQRAAALKIHEFERLPATSRQALAALRDQAVFYQASKLAVETGMTTEEIRDLTRAVKSLPSEGARIEHIGAVAKDRGIEAATRKIMGRAASRVSSPKQTLVTGIGKVLNVDEAALVRQIVTSHDRDLINQRLSLLEKKLAILRVAMGTLRDLGEE
jgi:ParB-like chromosome segregation protein Spo0J